MTTVSLILIFTAVGAAGGFTAGLFGVGGGLVIVPTLYFMWRDDPLMGPQVMHFAVATSLACIVVTSMVSSFTHFKAKKSFIRHFNWLAGAVCIGSFSAVLMANWLPTYWLKVGFGLFALSVCLTMLKTKNKHSTVTTLKRPELMGAGSFIGYVSTLLGVSGGAMTVPYLVLRGVDLRQAVVASSGLAIPISIIGSIGLIWIGPNHAQTLGYVHWPAFVAISLVSIYFASWGARLSQSMDQAKLQRYFAIFLGAVAFHMLST